MILGAAFFLTPEGEKLAQKAASGTKLSKIFYWY